MFSSRNLTPRQSEILEFLQECRREERIVPTYREIADHFRFKSTKAVADHLSALEKKGYIRRRGKLSRSIELISSVLTPSPNTISVPIVGNIPAGQPEQKAEQHHGTLAVDSMMLGNVAHHRLFALQVRGDSMEGRGIQEGDWVIADVDATPRENDVVIALIDGENTLKTLAKQKRRFFLKAENPDHSDWIPFEELIIQGVARAILRRIS